jgi:hypothetical protein
VAIEVAFERLLGRQVRDLDGRPAGRVEEVHARRRGGEVLVSEYVLGTSGLVERLSLGPVLRALLGSRLYPTAARYTIGWDELDVSDPERPRLKGRVAELERRRPERAKADRRASA